MEIDYCPEPKQSDFHKSKAKYRLYIGAWRAGKTYAGCQEALRQLLDYPGNRGLIGRKDYSDLRDTTIRTFFEICPENLIAKYNKTEHYLVLVNGSEVLFRELKDETGLGSLNLGFFYIDEAEEVQENIFERLKGRLSLATVPRQCGWLTSNPPNTDHWIHKQFEGNIDPYYETFHASTYENSKYLPKGYISSLEKLPDSWKKKYLMGDYGFTPDGTPFYPGFKEVWHKNKLTHNTEKPLFRAWDYGFRHPACSIHQIDAKGRWLILKEILGTDITINQFGEYVKVKCNEWYPNAKWIDYGDPAGNQKSDKNELTSVEILASMGIFVGSKFSTYRERKEIIERKMATLIEGIPSLQVDEECRTIIDGFLGGYHYPVKKQGQVFNPHIMELPFRDGFYEHLMNTIEYFAVNEFTGAESKDETTGDIHYKVVGPLRDIKFMDDEEDTGETFRKWQRQEPIANQK